MENGCGSAAKDGIAKANASIEIIVRRMFTSNPIDNPNPKTATDCTDFTDAIMPRFGGISEICAMFAAHFIF
jgi:hypothetical protein